jgi:DNA-binding beta-propeller fold protein YncE
MAESVLVYSNALYAQCSAQVYPQTNMQVCAGSSAQITLTGINTNSYSWMNNLASIGLAATGTTASGTINFVPVNNTGSPVTANIIVTPVAGNFFYVGNRTNKQLLVFNRVSGSLVTGIAVGDYPWDVEISPDRSRILVPNFDANSFTFIDATNNTVINTFYVNSQASTAVFSPDGTKAYMGYSSGYRVLNLSNNNLTTVYVTGYLSSMTISKDGSKLYIGTAGSIQVYNTATNTRIAQIPVLSGAYYHDLTLSASGNLLYAPDIYDSKVTVVNAATNTFLTDIILPNNDKPYGASMSPDGSKLYVAGGQGIHVINTSANAVTGIISSGSFYDVAADPDGVRLYGLRYATGVETINRITNSTTSYAVSGGLMTLDVGACAGASTQFNVSVNNCTASNEAAPPSTSLELYPNPVGKLLHVKINSQKTESWEVNIIDATGRICLRIVRNINYGFNDFTIDLSKIPGGSYFFISKGGGREYSGRFIHLQ